jgi:hypothetical protein
MKRGSFLAGFPFLAALLAVLASCGSDDCPDCPECVPPVTGSIFGYVRVTPVNDFLPGVTVRAEPGGVTAQSDSAGLYRLNGLAGGTYMVHFAKAGYAPDSAAVPLTAGASQLVDIRLASLADSLRHLASVTTAGGSYGLAVREGIAYVAGNAGLQVFDLTDPAQPAAIGLAAFAGADMGAVVLSGDIAYVAHKTDLLEVVDVSVPAAPTRLGAARVGGRAFDLELDGSVLLAATGDSLVLLDVSTPETPQVVSRLATARTAVGGSNRGIALDTSRHLALVFSLDTGTEIFDYGDPEAVVRVGVYGLTWSPYDGCVDAAGSRGYLATTSGLEFMSYAQPGSPQYLGFWHAGSDWRDVLVVRSLAIMASPQYGIWVVDIADPGNVRTLQLLQGDLIGHPRNIAREGDRVYVAGDARLTVLEFAAVAR